MSAPRAAALALLLAAGAPAAAAELVVASWGGAYQKSQEAAVFRPWERRTGHRLVVDGSYSGGLAEIKAQVETGAVAWQTLVMEAEDALLGCEEGLLEPLDPARLPPAPDGAPATEDFIDGGLFECGVGSEAYAMVFTYDYERLPDGPETIGGFYDLAKYPGKRGLRKTPLGNLEMALVADGVPPARVYQELRTAAGVDRAFAKLDTLRGHAIWWEAASQPPQLLADGEVAMTTAYNGRIFDAIAAEGKPFRIVWDAQVYGLDYYVVPRGAAQKELAMDLIAFATSTEVAADLYSRIAYMPLRRSALDRIGAYYADPDLDMRPHMPLAPENAGNAVRLDSEFWIDYKTELTERFRAWLIR